MDPEVAASDWNAPDARPSVPWGRKLSVALARRRGAAALRAVAARLIADDEADRLRNVVSGVAERVGAPELRIYLYEGPPNAFVARVGGHGVVAMERSFATALARSEVEAVAAQLLVRLAPPARTGDPVGYDDDVRAAALTRYPPALAAALEKAEPERGRFAPLYLVGEHPSHRPVSERIAALNDL